MTASIVPDTGPKAANDLITALRIPAAHLGYAQFTDWLHSLEPHSQACVSIDEAPTGAGGWNQTLLTEWLLLQHRDSRGVIHYCRSIAGMAPRGTPQLARVRQEADQIRDAFTDYLVAVRRGVAVLHAAYAMPDRARLMYAPLAALQDPQTRIWRVDPGVQHG